MSGIGHSTTTTAVSGDASIDGILALKHWADSSLSYSLPTDSAEYGVDYGAAEDGGFFRATTAIADATAFALDADSGTAADDGFSVEGFTRLTVEPTTAGRAHIRVAQTSSDPFGYSTAWSYYPAGGAEEAGDAWLSDVVYDFTAPYPGGFARLTILHEIGHALGLEHSHEKGAFGAVPSEYDAMEYSIMSYRSYPGATAAYYVNERWSYAQSYMTLDIAALQHLYGADFSTNSDDTRYIWTPGSGQTLVNGDVAIRPAGNRIFATVWDGGGTDTYVLRAYDTDLSVDLAPGAASVFSRSQLAWLGEGPRAAGNIYNALLFEGDTRSLIENAIGGSGNDRLTGNQANNRLTGNAGDDVLVGLTGRDTLLGRTGDDTLRAGAGADLAKGGSGADRLLGQLGEDTLRGGNGRDTVYGKSGDDLAVGGAGNDALFGGKGNDVLIGGSGRDVMSGGQGADVFRFSSCDDSPADAPGPDRILDFTSGEDTIVLRGIYSGRLKFIGSDPFSGTEGELRSEVVGRTTLVSADCDGDGARDFVLELLGRVDLTAHDFAL